MSDSISFVVYGLRHSGYSYALIASLITEGCIPAAIISIDDSIQNQVVTRCLMIQENREFFSHDWQTSKNHQCLLALAQQHQIPYIALKRLDDPWLLYWLSRNPQDAIVATDGPIVRGALLYAARYGIISAHAAYLPAFRGNWTTYYNLYHNVPLVVSAFIMQPWVDEGVILGHRVVAITQGMTLDEINLLARDTGAALLANTLWHIAQNQLITVRQEPWEGITYRGMRADDGTLLPAMAEALQVELVARFAAGDYGFYALQEGSA